MALAMKPSCEMCEIRLALDSEAYICSYECTYCRTCAEKTEFCCPNCNGELLVRPSRVTFHNELQEQK